MDVIRATVADVDAAAPLFASYREFYGRPYDVEASAAFLTARLEREESIVLLALDGDRTVGFAQIYPAFSSTALAPIWILNDLFVDAEARGGGVVDRLLEATAELAGEAGCEAIELATQHTNHRAQAVYDRHGYVVDEEFRHYSKLRRP
jgi:ribosomal protein S18 acetylase RimI-like enzyme